MRNILSTLLLFVFFAGFSQTTGRLPYTTVIQSYKGDTLKLDIPSSQNYVDFYTDRDYLKFSKPILNELTTPSLFNYLRSGEFQIADESTNIRSGGGEMILTDPVAGSVSLNYLKTGYYLSLPDNILDFNSGAYKPYSSQTTAPTYPQFFTGTYDYNNVSPLATKVFSGILNLNCSFKSRSKS